MSAAAVDQKCGQAMLALLLVIEVYTALAFAGVGTWEFLTLQALTAVMLVLWIARLWISPKPQFLWPPISWCALAFGLYAIGRYLTCDIEYVGRHEFLQVAVFTFLFLVVINNFFQQEMAQAICFTLIVIAMGTASYAIIQYATHSTHIWWRQSENPGRTSGTFMAPDHFCGYLEMILPLTLALLMAGRIKPLTRVLLGYSFLVIFGGIAVTFCRAGWISTVVSLLATLLILASHRNHRKAALGVLVLLSAGGVVFVTCFLSKTESYLERVANAQGKVNTDILVRKHIWADALRMWKDHLWWGVGPGHFDWRYTEYRSEDIQADPGWSHCDYLNLVTDWGVVGGILVLAGMVAAAAGVVRAWPRVRRAETDLGSGMSNRFAIFLGAVGGLTAIAVHSLVDFSLHVPADDLVALTLLALLSSSLRFATERYWHKATLPLKLAASLVCAVGAGYLGWEAYRLGNEFRWLMAAAKQPDYTLAQSKIREVALKYEPMNFKNVYAIGEGYRNAALTGATNAAELLGAALDWYQRGEKLDRYYFFDYLREGQCLDLLGLPDLAWQRFDEADRLDPNGYFTAANIGWHFLNTGDLTAARPWLLRSLELKPATNTVAGSALAAVEQELTAEAGNVK